MKSNFEEDCFWDDENGCFMRPSFFPNKWVPFRPSVWDIENPKIQTTEFRPHLHGTEGGRLAALEKLPHTVVSDNNKRSREDYQTKLLGKSEPVSPLKNLGDRGGEMPDISGSNFKDSEPWNIRNPESIQSRFGSQWQSDWAGSVPSLKNPESKGERMPQVLEPRETDNDSWRSKYPQSPQSQQGSYWISDWNGPIPGKFFIGNDAKQSDASGQEFKDSEPWNIKNPESIQPHLGSQWQPDWAGSVPPLKNPDGGGGEMPEKPGWSLGYPEEPQSEMPNSNFNDLVGKILEAEGGFVNHPNDTGKATNRGISWATWGRTAKSILGKEPTLGNLKDLTEGEAAQIYKQEYWDKMNLDSIEDKSLQHIIFDGGVNHGIGTSTRMVQKSINALGGQVKVDGALGPKTAEAVNKLDPEALFNQIKERRYAHYDKIIEEKPDQAIFRNGWYKRVDGITYGAGADE